MVAQPLQVAVCMNLLRDFLPEKLGRLVPLPMAMAIPFYLGAWLAIDMCIGAVIMLVWQWRNPQVRGHESGDES